LLSGWYPWASTALFGDALPDYLQDLWKFRWSLREMKVWVRSYFERRSAVQPAARKIQQINM